MFEDSLVELRVGQSSSSKRWTMLASVGAQFCLAAVVIVLPMLRPEVLPFHVESPRVLLPLPPRPVVREVQVSAASLSAAALSVTRVIVMPPLLPGRSFAGNEAPVLAPVGAGMGEGVPDGVGVGVGSGPEVSVAPVRAPSGPVRVSSGVSQGMLLTPIRPVYPAIAKAARVEGSVVVEAVISRMGTIESLRVVSGPTMLQSAALEAIRGARYQPYRLNGEATEVQTTITVNFRLAG
jgi:periplasmic protein TonB